MNSIADKSILSEIRSDLADKILKFYNSSINPERPLMLSNNSLIYSRREFFRISNIIQANKNGESNKDVELQIIFEENSSLTVVDIELYFDNIIKDGLTKAVTNFSREKISIIDHFLNQDFITISKSTILKINKPRIKERLKNLGEKK